ncbi:hypothetical protein DET49_12239 [Salegentibacter sp. 24]|nr:hypothetical protein DET49_12239 [Salegentibacter sp. 24]
MGFTGCFESVFKFETSLVIINLQTALLLLILK